MKRQKIAILAAALTLLLTAAEGTLAQTGPEVPWWIIAGGGNEGGGGGGAVIVNDTLGQPVVGRADGGTVALDAGYRQQLFAPAAVADVHASIVTGGSQRYLRLDWTDVTHDTGGHTLAGVTYDVYRAQDAPYFTPETPPVSTDLADPNWTDPETAVLTDPAHSTYYLVVVVHNSLVATPSNHVGVFVFRFVPGS